MAKFIFVLALFNASILICVSKWGFFEMYEDWGGKPKYFPYEVCTFCISFWMAIIECIAYCAFENCNPNFTELCIPLASAALTNFILKK